MMVERKKIFVCIIARQVEQLVEHHLSNRRLRVRSPALPGRGVSVIEVLLGSYRIYAARPPSPLSQMLEKSCVRVKWGAVQYRTAKSNFHGWYL